jgi:uncharacterized membrane protein
MEIQGTLWIHVATGSLAVMAGLMALLTKKGSVWHKRIGSGFVLTMLLMAISGVVIALLKPMAISTLAGLMTAYLVISSLWTIKDPANCVSRRQFLAPIASAAIAVSGAWLAWQAVQDEKGLKDGFTAEPYLFFTLIAVICCMLDIRLLIKGGLNQSQRLARHLWRMCFALFIAVGSFFSQGARMLPENLQRSAWLELPDKLVLLVMMFWLFKLLIYPSLKKLKPVAKGG